MEPIRPIHLSDRPEIIPVQPVQRRAERDEEREQPRKKKRQPKRQPPPPKGERVDFIA